MFIKLQKYLEFGQNILEISLPPLRFNGEFGLKG
jgi:hypothetical protein